MKTYNHLFEKIVTTENLYQAANKALKGKKYKQTTAPFYFDLENEVFKIQKTLIEQTYKPQNYRIFKIFEPKERKICCAEFRDRVVHHAIMNQLGPIFEKRLIYDTYACREGKGVHIALNKARKFVKKYDYYLKCDIKKYFESIDHQVLMGIINKIFRDKKLISLLSVIIFHRPPYTQKGKGLPIGNLTSQHLANLYLGELDLYIKHQLKCQGYVRYMDDFILFSNNKNELRNFLEAIRVYTENVLELKLKEKIVRISPVTEGLPFLGYRIFRGTTRLQRPNLVRFRRKVSKLEKRYRKGKITQDDLINSVRSVVSHISHGDTKELRKSLFR